MRRFGKIAGSNFEHQRFLLMARRAEGRKHGVILPAVYLSLAKAITLKEFDYLKLGRRQAVRHQVLILACAGSAKLPGAILNISGFC